MIHHNLFTVEDVAKSTGFHSKTVRRFIQEGKLQAHKVGGQWRIKEEDVQAFIGNIPARHSATPDEQTRSTSLSESHTRQRNAQVSSVVDIWVTNNDEAMRLSSSLFAAMNSKDPADGQARCDHLYYEDERRARFVLWGSPAFMRDMLGLIAEITK